jgi:hypothetical protein
MSMRRASLTLLALTLLVMSSCTDEGSERATEPSATAPVSTERGAAVEGFEVPMPDGVVEWGRAKFAGDDAIVATFRSTPDAPRQVGWLRTDGSDFSCVTCDVLGDTDVGSPLAFPDGERVWIQSPSNMNAASAFAYSVVRCAPSLAECTSADVKPVEGMIGSLSDPAGLQDREVRLSHDGTTIAWTRIRPDGYLMLLGRLTEHDDRYTVDDVRVVNPPGGDLDGDLEAVATAAAWYEAKDLSRDGRFLSFSGSYAGSLNYDSFLLDLATGEVARLTDGPDWEEDASLSPDGSWVVFGSAEGSDRQAVFGNLARPPVIDAAIVGPLSNYFLPRAAAGGGISTRRVGSNRFYLVSIDGQTDEDRGLGLDGEGQDGWEPGGGGLDWSPDGTSLLQVQRRRDPGTGEWADYRLWIRRLPDREPTRPPVEAPVDPDWAPGIDERPPRSDTTRSAILDGEHEGTVRLERTGTILQGTWTVIYDGYATDGCSYLSGTQTVTTTSPITATYEEHLAWTGCRTGRSDAEVSFAGPDTIGEATSTMAGRTYEKVLGSDEAGD